MSFTEHDFTLLEREFQQEFSPVVEEKVIELPPKKRELKASGKKDMNQKVDEILTEIEQTAPETTGTKGTT